MIVDEEDLRKIPKEELKKDDNSSNYKSSFPTLKSKTSSSGKDGINFKSSFPSLKSKSKTNSSEKESSTFMKKSF